ncbi:MAG: alpha/beta hydrolase, partial [Micromonosporaceae bacterium]
MVTYHELDGVKPGAVQELADGWGKLWRKRLEQRGDDVHEYAGRLRNHWEGEAADAAFGRLKRFRNELDATKAPVTTIETMLSGLAESLVQAKGMLDDAKAEAQRIPAKIVADGGDIEITYTGDEDLDKDHKMAIARSMADVLDTIDDALDIAAKADKSAAKALRELVPGFDPTSRRTGDVSAKDIPKPGTDPAKVNKWWNSLSPAEQQYLIHKYPERIGWLDGVPAICRDQANKVTLERERERNETRKDALLDRKHELESEHSPGGASERAAELERIKRELSVVNNNLKGIAALQDRLDEPGKGQPKAYLLGFEPGRLGDRDGDGMPDDDGRVVLAVGNPDTADNVATYVPGTGNDLGGVAGAVGYTDRMARDAETTAPHDDTVVIMWLGYDAPDDPLLNSPSGEYAQAASDDLRRFQDGLRATHE